MPRAAATRAELEQELLAARYELCDAEDRGDSDGAILARARCDTLLDRWLHTVRQWGD
jgi:hypothetical protein